jgi:hypothetical protein
MWASFISYPDASRLALDQDLRIVCSWTSQSHSLRVTQSHPLASARIQSSRGRRFAESRRLRHDSAVALPKTPTKTVESALAIPVPARCPSQKMHDHPVSPADAALIREFDGVPAPLLPILHRFHDRDGFVSDSALRAIATARRIPLADLFGTVTF